MTYTANDIWNTWESFGSGATITVIDGVLRVQDASTSTNGSRYIKFSARGGDLVKFDAMARAISGQARMWINLVGVGVVPTNDIIISEIPEFRFYSLEYVIPNTYSLVDVFVGFGCTTADIGDAEAFSPSVYRNGDLVNFPGYQSPIRVAVESGLPAMAVVQSGAGAALAVGAPTAFPASTITPGVNFQGLGGEPKGGNAVGIAAFGNKIDGPIIYFGKSRSNTVGAHAVVQNNDFLGGMFFEGSSGSSQLRGAHILSSVDGSPGAANMPARLVFGTRADGSGSVSSRLTISASGTVHPGADNTQSFGTSSLRWSTVFAGTGTINTSDARAKTDISDLDEAETRVAQRLKKLVKKYRFSDAVAEKGDKARIHVGVIAQDVRAAFEAEGLDPFAYSVLCFDKWEAQEAVTRSWPDEYDDEGNLIREAGIEVIEPAREAGDRYGIRYDELFAFILSAL